jgi:hypothetical protein
MTTIDGDFNNAKSTIRQVDAALERMLAEVEDRERELRIERDALERDTREFAKPGILELPDTDKKGHHMTTETVTRDDGVDMYGLYVEAVISQKMTGAPRRYLRLFLVDDKIYVYDRWAARKSTVWRTIKRADHKTAVQTLSDFFEGKVRLGTAAIGSMNTVALHGEPVLVQLRATDILEMEKGKAPASRYVGSGHVERNVGKFIVENWNVLKDGAA